MMSHGMGTGSMHGMHHGSGGMQHRWGHRVQGRWFAGWHAPGGWGAYRRPVFGYVLPRYWVQPTYFISNWGAYGLPAPRPGYGWSRYYDDAVLTDQYGRVYDSRSGLAWDQYEGGYDDGAYDDDDYAYEDRRDSGAGGAAIGAVVGGIAGNRIAGRGNRTEGTLIGAGVGAVAGYAIDKAEDRGRRDGPPPPHGAPPPGAPYPDDEDDATYSGRWVGTWHGDDGRTYSGEYRGTYEGTVPHWTEGGPPPRLPYEGPYGMPAGGYVSGGYYYPAPTVTTIVIQPGSSTTTTYVREVSSAGRSWPAKRHWRAKPRCAC
jgi:hypothetical protein